MDRHALRTDLVQTGQRVRSWQRRSTRRGGTTGANYDPAGLQHPAELRLHEIVKQVRADLDHTADLTRSAEIAGRITDPVNALFNDVFVSADDPTQRRAQLGLLAAVRRARQRRARPATPARMTACSS
jgi:glycyl-tRNA synthetase beta subunit